jgi:hypothetical protein
MDVADQVRVVKMKKDYDEKGQLPMEITIKRCFF